MRQNFIIYAVLAIIFAYSAEAVIFLGTADGYVFDMSGNPLQGANATASVDVCSGGASNGCIASAVSQSNGYFVIANLNVNPYATVHISVTANVNGYNGSGAAVSTANEFKVVDMVNITACLAPSPSLLIDQANSHNNSVILYWNSGTDYLNFSKYDQFQLDSGSIQNKTSPVSANVSYSSHAWRVRTCNINGAAGCCSPFSEDIFTIFNNAPLPPTLAHQGNTHSTSAAFSWTNGTDPDGDSVYHQFQIDSQPIQNNSLSPLTITNISFGVHAWRVRVCDFLVCGSWAEDSFSVLNNLPSMPNLTAQNPTTKSNVLLKWTSGVDPDGDPTYDELEFGTEETNMTYLTNVYPSVTVQNLSIFEKYYWGIRTCDFAGCSGWAGDSFNTYSCEGGGKGGKETETVEKIVEKIIPGPPIEVAPPALPGQKSEAKENATGENAKPPEEGMKAIVIPKTPTGFALSFMDFGLKNKWAILQFLSLICIIVIFLLLMKNYKKKSEEK